MDLGVGVVGHQPSGGAVPFVVITEAPSRTPTECSDFAASHGGGATWTRATFDIPTTGGTDNGLTVTITDAGTGDGGEPIFDWTSSQPVDAVFVKVATEGFLYLYGPEASADTGLTSPRDSISHITFCFDDDPPTTTTTPATTATLVGTAPTTSATVPTQVLPAVEFAQDPDPVDTSPTFTG